VLSSGVGADGGDLAVRVDDATGTIIAVGSKVVAEPGDAVVDCTGLVLLPAAAEPHVHLDKVSTIHDAPNPSGELMGAVRAWKAYASTIDPADVRHRARAAVDDLVAHGVTAIRTNVNIHSTIDVGVLDAILAVRDEVADRCAVQVVALFMPPLGAPGPATEVERAWAEEICTRGIDLVGGPPHTDADPAACVDFLVELAVRHGLGVDLHIDETLDPSARSLLAYADAVERHGLGGRAAAGHCVSLGMHDPDEQKATAARLADVGIAVVSLPTTNLWLQGRAFPSAMPRGLTAVRALLDSGVVVATGTDNIEDPFCPLGRADPFDAARLLSLAAHLRPDEAWTAASTSARTIMGLPGNDLTVGAAADLVAIEGRDLTDALARGSVRRTVVRAGAVVATTSVTVEVA
jgi:cytosine deaminase